MPEVDGVGRDTQGRIFKTARELWKCKLGVVNGRSSWYAKGASFWEVQEASLAGVLGGFAGLNEPDLFDSRRFLQRLRAMPDPPPGACALDCSAGIGRVTAGLLQDFFRCVDLAEPNERLLQIARCEVRSEGAGRFMACPLQKLRPEPSRYDVIWIQWGLGYLPDDDLRMFLKRCKAALGERGAICVKENVARNGEWLVDDVEGCITRTDARYRSLFAQSGLRIIHESEQTQWPEDVLPVRMYALRPDVETEGRAGGGAGGGNGACGDARVPRPPKPSASGPLCRGCGEAGGPGRPSPDGSGHYCGRCWDAWHRLHGTPAEFWPSAPRTRLRP